MKMKVTAVVPVYNEENTIENVLKVLKSHDKINEIIVIDDGSTDNTPNIIRWFQSKKVKILKIRKNTGKGNAVKIATKNINSDILLFIDADLIGLKKEHINKLLKPVIKDEAAMVIGLRDKGNSPANMIMPYFPLTGGERAILTKVFMAIRKNQLIEGWGLEAVMNDYCKKKKLKIFKVKLDGMNHIGLQTKKYGLMAFLKEIYDVVLTKIKLLGVRYD